MKNRIRQTFLKKLPQNIQRILKWRRMAIYRGMNLRFRGQPNDINGGLSRGKSEAC